MAACLWLSLHALVLLSRYNFSTSIYLHTSTSILPVYSTPTISLGSHQNIGLHTGACANVVLLTYLLYIILHPTL